MPRIAAATIKARVTKRFIRPPRPDEMTPHSSAGASMAHRIPGARDRRLSQQEPGYAASGERHDDSAQILWDRVRTYGVARITHGWKPPSFLVAEARNRLFGSAVLLGGA